MSDETHAQVKAPSRITSIVAITHGQIQLGSLPSMQGSSQARCGAVVFLQTQNH